MSALVSFSIAQHSLSRGLGLAGGTSVPSKSDPILGNVRLVVGDEGLVVTSTNLQAQRTAKCPVDSVGSPGGITVDAKKLASIVGAFPADAVLTFQSVDNDFCAVHVGNTSRYKLRTMPVEDFPALSPDSSAEVVNFHIPGKDLYRLMEAVSFIVAKKDSEPASASSPKAIRMAVDGGKIECAGIDKARIGVARGRLDVPPCRPVAIGVDPKCVADVQRLCSRLSEEVALVSVGAGSATITFPGAESINLLAPTQFPDYTRVLLPEDAARTFEVERNDVLSAISRVSLMTNEKHREIALEFTPGQISISASSRAYSQPGRSRDAERDPDAGDCVEAIQVDHSMPDGVVVKINCQYLADALSAGEEERVRVQVADGLGPVMLSPAGADPRSSAWTYIVAQIK